MVSPKIKIKLPTPEVHPEELAGTTESIGSPPLETPQLSVDSSGTSANPLLQETFEEFKARIFTRNMERLEKIRRKYPKDMLNVVIKQHDGRFVSIWKGGEKIITLMNNEIYYSSMGETEAFLKRFLGEFPNDEVETI